MKNFALILFGITLLGWTNATCQTKVITGKVVAFKAYPIKNVVVRSKKSKKEVLTDAAGNFSIESKNKDKLVFKAAGFQNESIKIDDQDVLKVNLIIINNPNAFKDIIKEGHMEQSDLDYCTGNLMFENNNFDQLPTIFDVIQFVYPTARISDANNPNSFGTTSSQIILEAKGANTIISSPYALLVVDGIVTQNISGIDPKQVKTVKVLTGTEAGHWGTRGGNGVVEITLKYD